MKKKELYKCVPIYIKRLIPKLFKLMPLKENKDKNYYIYLDKLIIQIIGFEGILLYSSKYPMVFDIVCNLKGLRFSEDIRIHNSIVKENINICQKVIDDMRLECDDNGV
jgi:hypothetical protein